MVSADQYHPILVKAFEIDKRQYLVMPWKDSFMGWSDYIDGIEPEDMTDAIMLGIDSYGRNYITVKVELSKGRVEVVTIFQKFTDSKSTWTVAGYNLCLGVQGWVITNNKLNNVPLFKANVKMLLYGNKHIIRESFMTGEFVAMSCKLAGPIPPLKLF